MILFTLTRCIDEWICVVPGNWLFRLTVGVCPSATSLANLLSTLWEAAQTNSVLKLVILSSHEIYAMKYLLSPRLRPFRTLLLLSNINSTPSKAQQTQHHNNQICSLFCTAANFHPPPKDNDASRHLYEPIEGVEKLENYCVGGYHPIKIGDHIHNRYQVVQKLGHGTYSTLWLAKDKKHNKYLAIKVCTADSSTLELSVLSELSNSQQSASLGKTMIPSVLDSFKIHGPNGTHLCYVTTPARMSLSEAKDASYNRLFQLEVARALAAQLVIAVEYVHSQGFIHGDLHYGNVLIQLPFNLNELFVEELNR